MSKTDDLFVMGVLGMSSVNMGRTRKRASQAHPAPLRPSEPLARQASREVLFNRDKYPVHVHTQKSGRIKVTITLPALVQGEWQGVTQCWTCTPAELVALADATPLGSAVGWQYAAAEDDMQRAIRDAIKKRKMGWQDSRAAEQLRPLTGPQRRSRRSLVKYLAAHDAKRARDSIQALLPSPDQRSPRFQHFVKTVEQVLGGPPTAVELTAWLVERLYENEWDWVRLRRPTKDMHQVTAWDGGARFAKLYLYNTAWARTPSGKAHQQAPLTRLALELERLLEKVAPLESFFRVDGQNIQP